MLKNFLQNTCKPEGLAGKFIVQMMNKGHTPLATWGFSHLTFTAGMDALDIGCGGGANLSTLLSRISHGTVTGIDYSPVCVEHSTRLNRDAIQSGRCHVLQGDASALPFSENEFDIVTAFETVYFWPDLSASFRQILKTLRPGGTFLICNEESDPNNDKWSKLIDGMTIYGHTHLEQLLKDAGFQNIRRDFNKKKDWMCITAQK